MSANMLDRLKQCLYFGKDNLLFSYILFLAGIFDPMLMLFSVLFTYAHKDTADGIYSSHYLFAFRTFCFAIVGFILAFLSKVILIGHIFYIIVFV